MNPETILRNIFIDGKGRTLSFKNRDYQIEFYQVVDGVHVTTEVKAFGLDREAVYKAMGN